MATSPMTTRQRRTSWLGVTATALLAALACGCAQGTGVTDRPPREPAAVDPTAAMADVVIQNCQVDTKSVGSAWTKPQSYVATIVVDNSAGMRVGEATVSAHGIGVGESRTLSAVGFAAPNPDQIHCVVATVNRISSS